MKMEEYMESELFCIFWLKLVAENIVLGSQKTQCCAAPAVSCLFLKNIKLYWWQNRSLVQRSAHSVNNADSASTVEPEVEPEVESEVEPKVEQEVESEVDPEVESEVDSEVESEVEPEAESGRTGGRIRGRIGGWT